MKIKKIDEIVDANGELIGSDKYPNDGGDMQIHAKGTTDDNIVVGRQPYTFDTISKFGTTLFPFYEGKGEDKTITLVNKIGEILFNYNKVLSRIFIKDLDKLKHFHRKNSELKFSDVDENTKNEYYSLIDKILNEIQPYLTDRIENNIVEDKMLDKTENNEFTKKTEVPEIKERDLKKIAGLINKMDKTDVDKLINLIEYKR